MEFKKIIKYLLVLAIILFLVMWGFSMWNPQKSNKFKYAGQTWYVVNQGGLTFYVTFVEFAGKKQKVVLRSDPRSLANISMDPDIPTEILSAKKIYITFDPINASPYYQVALYELYKITNGLFRIPTIPAFTRDADPPNPDVPLRDCDDAKNGIVVIVLNITDQNTATLNDDCIYVNAKDGLTLVDVATKVAINCLNIPV